VAPPSALKHTLAAVRASLEVGAQAVEVDVWLCADGIPVLMHDATVDRTTNGQGKVAEKTLADLRALDAGNGEPVPTLQEVLETTHGHARLNIEIKDPGAHSEVVQVVRSLDAAPDVWVSSFSPDVIEAVKWVAPEIERSFLFSRIHDDHSRFILYTVSNLLLRSLSPSVEFIRQNPGFIELCQRRSVRCNVWTVDDPAAIGTLADMEVDGFFTNDPRLAQQVLEARAAAVPA
jgi:glycerophosphoryl diester phosphodiesterase